MPREMRTHDSPPLPEPVKEVSLFDALKFEGFDLPEGAANVRLSSARGSVFVLSYDLLIEGEALAKLGRALVRVAEGRRD